MLLGLLDKQILLCLLQEKRDLMSYLRDKLKNTDKEDVRKELSSEICNLYSDITEIKKFL